MGVSGTDAVIIVFICGVTASLVFVALPYASTYQETGVSHDKSFCSKAGAELLDYTQRYERLSDASGKLRILLGEQEVSCFSGKLTEDMELLCEIGTKSSHHTCIRIYSSGTHCLLEEADC